MLKELLISLLAMSFTTQVMLFENINNSDFEDYNILIVKTIH